MKNRFKLSINGEPAGEYTGLTQVAKKIGCTRAHIYNSIDITRQTNHFTYKKVNYTIIDKLT